MNLLTTIKLSIKEILSNKLRSLLTMLGVIIGVFSIIVLVSIGKGATASITADLEEGSDIINVNIYPYKPDDLMNYDETIEFFSDFDPKSIAPIVNNNIEIKYGDFKSSVSVTGIDISYLSLNNLPLINGRTITPLDLKYRHKVTVINELMAKNFFKDKNPIGKTIKMNGDDYQVIGIIKDQEASMFRRPQEESYVPITTAQRAFQTKGISSIQIQAASSGQVLALSDQIKDALEEKYPTDEGQYEQYYIYTPEEIIKEVNTVTGTLTMMIAGIAGISLLVGGIGIMNIMFVSVTERTREIGIRKSIGAQRKNILLQFLIESSVVSGVGGIIGILLGIGVSTLIGKLSPLQTKVDMEIILFAFSFSLAIGIVFGIYPANKAAKLKPIDALRFE
ncbi:ABC transporter permease [Brassicibacter mesophilus]|uniref:ABC transporter permease n=1 Tax=Brassicibacter mesophilus TaxID=745119 RepID=UPI003D24FDFE